MDLRRLVFLPAMRVIRHPRVERLLADRRAMELFVMAVRGKALLAAAATRLTGARR